MRHSRRSGDRFRPGSRPWRRGGRRPASRPGLLRGRAGRPARPSTPTPVATPTPVPTPTPDPNVPPAGSGCGKPYPPPISRFKVKVLYKEKEYYTVDSTPLVGPNAEYCASVGFPDRTICTIRQEGDRRPPGLRDLALGHRQGHRPARPHVDGDPPGRDDQLLHRTHRALRASPQRAVLGQGLQGRPLPGLHRVRGVRRGRRRQVAPRRRTARGGPRWRPVTRPRPTGSSSTTASRRGTRRRGRTSTRRSSPASATSSTPPGASAAPSTSAAGRGCRRSPCSTWRDEVVGIDASLEMLRHARRAAGVRYVASGAEALPFRDGRLRPGRRLRLDGLGGPAALHAAGGGAVRERRMAGVARLRRHGPLARGPGPRPLVRRGLPAGVPATARERPDASRRTRPRATASPRLSTATSPRSARSPPRSTRPS